jgi:hypothetical protein
MKTYMVIADLHDHDSGGIFDSMFDVEAEDITRAVLFVEQLPNVKEVLSIQIKLEARWLGEEWP